MEPTERDTGLTTAPESELLHEIATLRAQLVRRDEQIAELQERCREQAFVVQRDRWVSALAIA